MVKGSAAEGATRSNTEARGAGLGGVKKGSAAEGATRSNTEAYLPHPDEQLVLMPDTSTSNLCSGWVLYTQRSTSGGKTWLPVQYASARLPKYMDTWTPCEQEALGAGSKFDGTHSES